jgi:succinate dehydrogenase / fumarate reductase flavoprotein subunit
MSIAEPTARKTRIDPSEIDEIPVDSKVPEGPLEEKWTRHKGNIRLVAPNNKRKFEVIVVGTGLAGASAAASLAELGYNVKAFCYHDSPRRAHSIAAQGGINASKNYRNDGDSDFRLFYDTIKGGDFRAREANVYRLAESSVNIIDQCVAQGVPFARDYGGLLATRSFGGAQVSRTFYAKGQTGQQLLLGAYSAMSRQIHKGQIQMYPKTELMDIVKVDGKCRGIVVRNLVNGKIESHHAHAVLLCSGGYGNVYYLSTNARNSNVSAAWRAYKRGAYFANPGFVQVHPTCIPQSGDHQSKLTLMSESLRNDGRVWVPRDKNDSRHPNDIPEEERWYYLEERYPAFGNLVPRDVASRNAKDVCDKGYGIGPTGNAVYLDFASAIERYGRQAIISTDTSGMSQQEVNDLILQQGRKVIADKYGNLFDIYHQIKDINPYYEPMRIFPAVHYTMGGLWVDYNLSTNIPGLYALGEANFSDHGANRLGASALMQGLADGYFVIPYTLGDYLATQSSEKIDVSQHEAFQEAEQATKDRIEQLLSVNGTTPVLEFHRELGQIMWNHCSIERTEASLKEAKEQVRELRQRFWQDVKVLGTGNELNQNLEHASRVADFLELGELMIDDALMREESCGCHFRTEYTTEDGEAKRRDDEFAFVGAWAHNGDETEAKLYKESLNFENVKLTQRSYK